MNMHTTFCINATDSRMLLLNILAFLLYLIVVQSYVLKSYRQSSLKLLDSIKPSGFVEDRQNAETKRILKGLTITGDTITPCRSFKVGGKKTVEYLDSFFEFKSIPRFNIPEIAILGRSNVGKSSLLNMLAGVRKNIAVVSKMPGRTRSVNLFQCRDLKGPFAMLVDLPGYGFARMSKELRGDISHAAVAYLRNRRSLVAALLLIDCRRGYQESDISVMELLESLTIPYSIIVTKVDQLNKMEFMKCYNDVQRAKNDSDSFPVIMSSSETGFGKNEIWGTIKYHMVGDQSTSKKSSSPVESQPIENEQIPTQWEPKKKSQYDPATDVEWFPGD